MKNIFWKRQVVFVGMALSFFLSLAMTAMAVDFMPIKEVVPGMKGYAKTVVEGTRIDSFSVEVIGVMKNKGPAGDLILARFSGPLMDKYGGIAQGMSGSPVYINGKLVGAVSYGWGFSDSKIGMVTPIEDMVKLWSVPTGSEIKDNRQDLSGLVPISTPLMTVGFDSDALQWFSSKLPGYRFTPVDTAAGVGGDKALPLYPGSSVAASFITGDLKMGAIGTVTAVDGNNIVAFGHPFLKRGSMNYFLHNAYIFTVLKSLDTSFKLGSVDAEIGSINQDRGAGIAGDVGSFTAGIPLRVTVTDADTNTIKNANMKLINDDELTPVLAATGVYSYVNKTIDRLGGGTASIQYTLMSRDDAKEDITRSNMFYSSSNVNEKSIDELYNVLDILMHNEFINYAPLDIKMSVDITEEKQVADIVEATASPVVASPGDTIYFKVKLHPYRGEEFIKNMTFIVPADQPLGAVTLEVRGGGVIPLPYVIEKQRYNLTDEIIKRLRKYTDFDHLRSAIEKEDTNNEIVIEILKTGISMIDSDAPGNKKQKLQEQEKNNAPVKLAKSKDDSVLEDDDKSKSKVVMPYVITGDGQITIKIMTTQDRDKALKKLKSQQEESVKIKVAAPSSKKVEPGESVAGKNKRA